jgi:nicotinic acid phosphoribosyltransferase
MKIHIMDQNEGNRDKYLCPPFCTQAHSHIQMHAQDAQKGAIYTQYENTTNTLFLINGASMLKIKINNS